MNSEDHYENFDYLNEKLYGTRIKYNLGEISLGGGFYEQKYDPYLDPSNGDGYITSDYYFRGDRIRVFALDAIYEYRNLKMFLDWGRSSYHTFDRTKADIDEYANSEPNWYWDNGDAYQLLGILNYKKIKFYSSYHMLSPNYFAFYSSPWVMGPAEVIPHRKINFCRNEEGYISGVKSKFKNYEMDLSFKYGRYIRSPQSTYYEKYHIYWLNTWKPLKRFVITFRHWPIYSLKKDNNDSYVAHRRVKNRIELMHYPSNNVRLKWRYEHINNSYTEINDSDSGIVTFGELKYKPTTSLTVYTRITYWDTGNETTVGALEFLWPNVIDTSGFYRTGEKNYRWYIMPTVKFSKKSKLWFKYEFWPKEETAYKNVFKLQYDCSW
jgi:hypothetical protein